MGAYESREDGDERDASNARVRIRQSHCDQKPFAVYDLG